MSPERLISLILTIILCVFLVWLLLVIVGQI